MYMPIKIAEIHSTITLQLFRALQSRRGRCRSGRWRHAEAFEAWGHEGCHGGCGWGVRRARREAWAGTSREIRISGMFLQEKTGEQNDDLCESKKSKMETCGIFFSRNVNVPIGIWHQNNQTETARWHRWTWKLSEIVQSYRFMAQVIRVPARNAWGPHLTGFHFVCMCAFMSSKKRHTKQPNMPTDLKNRFSKGSHPPKPCAPRIHSSSTCGLRILSAGFSRAIQPLNCLTLMTHVQDLVWKTNTKNHPASGYQEPWFHAYRTKPVTSVNMNILLGNSSAAARIGHSLPSIPCPATWWWLPSGEIHIFFPWFSLQSLLPKLVANPRHNTLWGVILDTDWWRGFTPHTIWGDSLSSQFWRSQVWETKDDQLKFQLMPIYFQLVSFEILKSKTGLVRISTHLNLLSIVFFW